jgi:putative nucleotidyltransferase with HDIG domain
MCKNNQQRFLLERELEGARERLRKTERLCLTVSRCHKALVEEASEAALLDRVCGILTECGGYHPVRVVEEDVVPSDSSDASWVRLPLRAQGVSFGVLEVRAPGGAPSEQETTILVELADMVSFGMAALRTRAAVQRTEAELSETLKNLRAALGGVIGLSESIVEVRDPCTAGHQRRVADLARSIATNLGLPKDEIEGIRIAGAIHDIGKVSIPADILCKPGPLTPFEYDLVKSHPKMGYDLLKTIRFPWPVADIVYQHHEHLDGSGYPLGLSGKDIRMEARIIRVADVVEAMVSHRPYRPAYRIDDALGEITRKQGFCFDAAAVASCVDLFMTNRYVFK